MIERNQAIDLIGEVTILAGMEKTSVTIEAVTDNVVAYISRKDASRWLEDRVGEIFSPLSHHRTCRSAYGGST